MVFNCGDKNLRLLKHCQSDINSRFQAVYGENSYLRIDDPIKSPNFNISEKIRSLEKSGWMPDQVRYDHSDYFRIIR